jgi:hypothetical protein
MFPEISTNRNINQLSEEYPNFQNFNFGYNQRTGGIGKLDPQEVSYANVFNLSPLVSKPPPKPSSTGMKTLSPFSSIDNMNNAAHSQNCVPENTESISKRQIKIDYEEEPDDGDYTKPPLRHER